MKLFLLRLLLIAAFFMLFHFVIFKNLEWMAALFVAFVCEYIIEPYLSSKM